MVDFLQQAQQCVCERAQWMNALKKIEKKTLNKWTKIRNSQRTTFIFCEGRIHMLILHIHNSNVYIIYRLYTIHASVFHLIKYLSLSFLCQRCDNETLPLPLPYNNNNYYEMLYRNFNEDGVYVTAGKTIDSEIDK